MKKKKIIIFIIAIILLLSVTIRAYATDEIGSEINDNTGSDSGNNNDNNPDNNDNNEQPGNNENENQENNPGDENTGSQTEDPTGNDNPGEQTEDPIGNDNPGNQEETTDNPSYQDPISDSNSGSSYITNYTSTIPTKSSNANLKSLSVNVEDMSPSFNAKTTEYYITVDLTVNEINVQAQADDEKATVTINGNTEIKEGQNTIEITVKAEDDTVKKYYIYVTKTDDLEGTNANLKSLVVNGWTMYPQFKTNIYSYSITIDQKISKLDIIAETENEEAKYEISGNENLEDGDNLIKIIVTAKDGETKKEYKINAFLSSITVKTEQESKTQAIVLLIVLGIAIAVIVYALINKK